VVEAADWVGLARGEWKERDRGREGERLCFFIFMALLFLSVKSSPHLSLPPSLPPFLPSLPQPILFVGTIAENIAYGLPSASRESVIAAAKSANGKIY
jgi:ABC-type multidrug transport system fused ATPase/permease subunit